MFLRIMKNKKNPIFGFWDMVDLNCEKSEKYAQNFFFHPISIRKYVDTLQTILRKKMFAFKNKKCWEISCWNDVEG